jgi:hypothetical protein
MRRKLIVKLWRESTPFWLHILQVRSQYLSILSNFQFLGNLRDDSLKIAHAMKKFVKDNDIENSRGYLKAVRNWMKETKAELMAYFESRPRPENQLPADIDRQFNSEMGMLYDLIYTAYAPFVRLYDMDVLDELESNEAE